MGASQRDIQIALMAAMQESNLRNLNYGDRDSIGLFQQRNAWASRADRLDPAKAARMFFKGGQRGQRGLLSYNQRNQWSLTQAAQKVQVSAYPNAYAKWEADALGLLGKAGGSANSDGVMRGDLAENRFPGLAQQGEGANLLTGQIGAGQGGTPDPTEASQIDTKGMPLGVSSASMPGIESGDKMPVFEFGEASDADSGGGGALPELDDATYRQTYPQGVPASGKRDLVIRTAKSFLGTPYLYGGNDASGIDCSALMQKAFKAAGINLPRISYQQANYGKRVAISQLRPGDMVATDNSSRNNGADHIALWLGNGMILEAPRSGLSVRIRQLGDDENYWGVAIDY